MREEAHFGTWKDAGRQILQNLKQMGIERRIADNLCRV